MCIFRIKYNGTYMCGKRYPLACLPSTCPFGQLYEALIRNDFKTDKVWLMPGNHLVTVKEAIDALKSGSAEYVVKSISIEVGRRGKRKSR